MNPRAIDAVQMIHDSLPTVAATAPIENSTNGGTPLATQNAPVQSIPRWSPSALATLSLTAPFTAALTPGLYPCAARSASKTTAQLLGDFKTSPTIEINNTLVTVVQI